MEQVGTVKLPVSFFRSYKCKRIPMNSIALGDGWVTDVLSTCHKNSVY